MTTNAEKFKAIVQSDAKISLAIDNFEFESKGLKLESDSVTLFPLLLLFVMGFGIIVAYRLGVSYAPVYASFILIYSLRSSLFREIRK